MWRVMIIMVKVCCSVYIMGHLFQICLDIRYFLERGTYCFYGQDHWLAAEKSHQGKIKLLFPAVKVEEVNSMRQVESETLHPSLIGALVHLQQSGSLSLSEESFYQPPLSY